MPETETSREEELRSLLTDAIEVQLAALKAGISFWSEWIDETSGFVQSATDSLSAINSGDRKTEDALLELVDAGRARARAMTEIPRHTAERFIEELDRAGESKAETSKSSASKAPAKKSGKKSAKKSGGSARAGKKSARATRPKRSSRVKE